MARPIPVIISLILATCLMSGCRQIDSGQAFPADVPQNDFVAIPGGEFEMGGTSADNTPVHTVRIAAFEIQQHEVTNAEYAVFCDSTGRRLPDFWGVDLFRCGPAHPDHPVSGVSWYDARDYAAWIGARLPTEAEWEYAARGGLAGAKYVWEGDETSPERANFWKSDGPVAVRSYEPNGYGLYDMTGNVNEWVADWYDDEYYAASPRENPAGPEEGKFRVLRGGGWHTGPGCIAVSRRSALIPGFVDFNAGFRCARDPQPSAGD